MTNHPSPSGPDARLLSAEQVAAVRRRYGVNVAPIGSGETRLRDAELTALCDSHESLRAALTAAKDENDQLKAAGKVIAAANKKHFDTATRNHEAWELTNADLQEARAALAAAERARDDALNSLGECYRLSGADPDGDENWRLAPHAVTEVRRLREESDAENARLSQSLAAAEAEQQRLRAALVDVVAFIHADADGCPNEELVRLAALAIRRNE